MKIPFNKPLVLGTEEGYVHQAIERRELAGNGEMSKQCAKLLEAKLGCNKAIMTPSCTDALEMCALLCDIRPGDEVIIPSYTFVSTASAFALRGAEVVWCDIRPDTKNLNERQIETLVTEKTKAVVIVHYGGVACEMNAILELCRRHKLKLIEDAAQAIDCTYGGKPLGSFGDLAAFSFHESKNIQCGEGGALVVNDPALVERAEFTRDKGTNRSQFLKGIVDKYTWVELGSSFLMSELQAAFLLPQMERSREVNARRLAHWHSYYERLSKFIPPESLPVVPSHCEHNAHMFYILMDDSEERGRMIEHLAASGIGAVFHYVPLHKAPYWNGKYSVAKLPVTEKTSNALLRLPLFYDLSQNQIEYVCERIRAFKTWQGAKR